MSFVNTHYFLHLVVFFAAFVLILAWLNRKYFRWVKAYWFYERSWYNRISSLFYMIGFGLMLLALLDLRGPEEKIKSNLPDQRTIVIIDSSSSMLAEDVRPSRFVKSLQLARHFVKNAAGHQISIVLFSDIQKRLVPFTDDIDLLDSRLSALEKTNSVTGGSNVSQAIAEAVQYFETDDDKQSLMGNILVFTDAEESEGGMDVELSGSYNLAVVGVGTAKGGNIPLRWDDGSFRGYKTFKGEPVTTRLDEAFIKKMGKNVKNYRYWIANSYSLPTDEILGFFRSSFNKTVGKGDVKVRPVFSHLILIPAIIVYCLAVVLGRFKTFRTLTLLFLFTLPLSLRSQEPEVKKLSPETIKDLEKIKAGKASRKHILKTAEKLLREDQPDRAAELYKEYLHPNDEEAAVLNQATALLRSGKLNEALPLVQKFLSESKDEDAKNKLRSNLLLALTEQEQKKEQKKQQQNKDQQDQKQDQNQSNDGKDGKDQKDQGKDGKDQNQKDKKDGKQDDKNKDSNKSGDNKSQNDKPSDSQKDQDEKKDGKDGKPKDPKDLKQPERESRPQTLEDKEKMIEQKRKMVKTPAMIKQIMSDDRELQKRMMDTSTKERGEQRNRRDW